MLRSRHLPEHAKNDPEAQENVGNDTSANTKTGGHFRWCEKHWKAVLAVFAFAVTVILHEMPLVMQSPQILTMTVKECTSSQLQAIEKQLPTNTFCFSRQWTNQCPITLATKCPESSWIESYSSQQEISMEPFLAINVGCNKGTDAVKILRMGTMDASVDVATWKSALQTIAPQGIAKAVCGEENSNAQFAVLSRSSLKRSGQVHCIEPLPITFEVLKWANHLTDYVSKGLEVHGYAISSENGQVYFPKSDLGAENYQKVQVGTENKGIGSCAKIKDEQELVKRCELVTVMTLDAYVKEYLPKDRNINYILTDVEGFDFDVIIGGTKTLKRTEYLEFEFNWKERWGSKDRSLPKTVEFLDNLGFTCYWAGRKKLWRITLCLLPHYDKGKFWSNVACVNRNLAPVLASEMEYIFSDTIQE